MAIDSSCTFHKNKHITDILHVHWVNNASFINRQIFRRNQACIEIECNLSKIYIINRVNSCEQVNSIVSQIHLDVSFSYFQ